jgi:hypothetical protein
MQLWPLDTEFKEPLATTLSETHGEHHGVKLDTFGSARPEDYKACVVLTNTVLFQLSKHEKSSSIKN